MTIIDHIQYLICRHDCVVVAGLGAFVSRYNPARVSADGSTLLPPSRSLAFNGAISHDDGLLAGSVARRDGVTYESARQRVDREVETLIGRIDVEGVVDLPRIGRLQRGDNGFIFSPAKVDPIVNMRYESLPAIALSEAMISQPVEEPTLLEVNVARGRGWGDRLRAVGRYAAAVAVLAVIGATLSTPVIVDRQIDHASFAPAVKPAKTIVVPAVKASVDTAAVGSQENDAIAKSCESVVAPSIISVADLKGDTVPAGYNCYIVVASCSTAAEARRYVSTHGGWGKLRVISGDGHHRVYAAVANDYDLAYQFKSEDPAFSKRNPSAWVLRD
ncbi:MAG: hypothetical protein HDS53_07175 [Barnesiella sp.]|nr:hypothetical protein [Barnesiella sp.]